MDIGRFKRWHTEYPVNVVYSEKKGRHMIATRDLVQGDVLLSDFPYCWAVDETAKNFVCQNCFLEMSPYNLGLAPDGSQPEFTKCPDCQQCSYCSDYCLAADYPQHSIDECAIFRNLEVSEYSPVIITEIKLLVRTLSRKWLEAQIAENQENGQEEVDESKKYFYNDNLLRYDDYASLTTNKENFPSNTIESLDYWICDYIRRLTEWVGGRQENNAELLDILLRNRCNAFYIQGRTDAKSSGETRGCGVYVRNSFFNHSCAPNVNYWVIDNSLKVECTSAGTCKEGEELTISYIDSTLSLQDRRAKLSESYMFHCDCSLCTRQEKEQADEKGSSENNETYEYQNYTIINTTTAPLEVYENTTTDENDREIQNGVENETLIETEESTASTTHPEYSDITSTDTQSSEDGLPTIENLSISSEKEEDLIQVQSNIENSEIVNVNETQP